MAVVEHIPVRHLRDRLGDYPHPIDEMADTKSGKRITSYTGCVLDRYERNYYDDSDFYAIVYDHRTDTCRSLCVGTTRGVMSVHCTIDATEEVKAKAREWLFGWHCRHIAYSSYTAARKIEPGRYVRFIKPYRPRKAGNLPVEVGQLAYVIRLYPDCYGADFNALVIFTNGPHIGLKAFSKLDKLAVFAPEHYERSQDEIEQLARRHADSEGWRAPFSPLVYA